ncbi:thiamine pyrophosphate-binding protein [Nocardioides sp. GY 10127]|uniref:thiamine pyrophosphate-binding protein n=1 Tax=Nocardioides sp. GY 10127 TaxID=2569762 RepID=UPI0010A7A727|nr:thiamine pyrophosphate-binding protein [Nocardioides sp. GY 10127]TIC79999.1 thiamine pyrophosphate-binding protein [Nocardioides sp. GY 10127]
MAADVTAAPQGRINVGHAVVRALVAEGVQRVYGMPGGHVLPIYDGIHATEGIESVLVRHEHHAAAMAAAEAQLTGVPGVVLVTAGPGVTNTLTAVAEAHVGATPMVVLGGRGATSSFVRGASQEVATDRVFEPVTKWTVRVDRADLLVEVVRQAFAVSRAGRPGPVLVDVPRDVLTQHVEDVPYLRAEVDHAVAAPAEVVRTVAAELAAASRPLLVCGGGALASGAGAQVAALAELLDAPVLTSLSGRGVLDEDDTRVLGGLGAHRNPVAKRALGEADVVLGLGTRFEEMESNWQPGAVPRPEARYVQVDLEAAEHGRGVPAHRGVVADVATFVGQLVEELGGGPSPSSSWDWAGLAAGLAEVEAEIESLAASEQTPIHPTRVIRAAREVFDDDAVLGIDVGALAQHIAGAFPNFRVHSPRSTVMPSSFYGMGYVAAAIPAARLVHPERQALCFVGDGSFQMVMNVLPTAATYRLGVTWIVLNDDALGSIWDLQHHQYGDRILDTAFEVQPDLAAVARGCGCHGERVEDPAQVREALVRAAKANAEGIPAVVDVAVERVRLAQTKEHYFLTYPQD